MATFYNQATLSYSGGTVNSNVTSGELLEVLSAEKTAVVDEYTQGSDVTYVINIINSGNTPFTGLSVSDDLGAYPFGSTTLQPLDYVDGSVKYFVNGVLQPAPTVAAGTGLVISGLTVPANGTATVLYAVTVNGFASPQPEGTVTNTAVISGGGITPITVTETVGAASSPKLDITKSLSPATVTENGQLTYTFVIRNTGNSPATAADNVVITDTFSPVLSNITVTYNGTPWSSPGQYTYDEATGLFATVPGAITVPAATYQQDAATGSWVVDPGTVILTVVGTV